MNANDNENGEPFEMTTRQMNERLVQAAIAFYSRAEAPTPEDMERLFRSLMSRDDDAMKALFAAYSLGHPFLGAK